MATLMELTSEIVSAHASATPLSGDELLSTIRRVHATLKELEEGGTAEAPVEEQKAAAISPKQSIKKSEVICLICGKGGMKTLTRHLSQAHGMKPGAYRKQFGIPRTQALAARDFTAKRKEIAANMDLASNLAKARETRAANIKAKKAAVKKPAVKRGAKKG